MLSLRFLALFIALSASYCWASARIVVFGTRPEELKRVHSTIALVQVNKAGVSELDVVDASVFFPRASGAKDTLALAHLARIAQNLWPTDEVFVIDAESLRRLDDQTLTFLLDNLARATADERRSVRIRSSGLLTSVSFPGDQTSVRALARPLAVGPMAFKAESYSDAKFFRNGILFDDVMGYGPGRGINIVVINPVTLEIESIYDFDTWYAPNLASDLAAQ